jgi:hypothetical protein
MFLLLLRYKKNAKAAIKITAAATPIPIPAAAPLESPEDVFVFGGELVFGADVGDDVGGVVDAGIEEGMEDVEDVEDEDEEVVLAMIL